MQRDQELYLWESFKNLFRPKRRIKCGDVGIYQDVLNISTLNDGTHSMNYDMYIKVRAVGVYQNLVEIEVIDVMTTNSHHTEVEDLIKANIPKYIKPKYVKWALPDDSTQISHAKEITEKFTPQVHSLHA